MKPAETCRLSELREGNRTLQEDFVLATYESLYRWLHWLTGNEHRAADLTQEAYTSFWTSLNESDSPASARVWLFAVARNVWRNWARENTSRKRQIAEPFNYGSPEPATEPSSIDLVIGEECRSEVRTAVASLPSHLREAVTLRYWENLDYKDLAHVLSTSPGTARQRVYQGRELLRKRLENWHPTYGD